MAIKGGFTQKSLREYVQNVPDDLWGDFRVIVEQEDDYRETELRQKAMEAVKAAASQYGFKVGDLFETKTVAAPPSSEGSISSSALNLLKKLSPGGLYNPKAPEDQRVFHKPEDKDRWVRIPTWLKEELLKIKAEKGRFSSKDLAELAERFPAQ